MKELVIEIKAKHLNGSDFASNCECGIANAVKDQLNLKYGDVNIGTDISYIQGMQYKHEFYGHDTYTDDAYKASYSNPDTVIRVVTLTLA